MDEPVCSICLFPITINDVHITAQGCNCTVKYHKDCLDLTIKSTGILCPICRNKTINAIIINNHNEGLIDKIASYPLKLFLKYPSPITFALYIMFSFIITITFIVPYLIYLIVKEKIPIIYQRMITDERYCDKIVNRSIDILIVIYICLIMHA